MSALQNSSRHTFKKARFDIFTWCNHCDTLIFGPGKQGRQCVNCGLQLHPKCVFDVNLPCNAKHELRMSKKKEHIPNDKEFLLSLQRQTWYAEVISEKDKLGISNEEFHIFDSIFINNPKELIVARQEYQRSEKKNKISFKKYLRRRFTPTSDFRNWLNFIEGNDDKTEKKNITYLRLMHDISDEKLAVARNKYNTNTNFNQLPFFHYLKALVQTDSYGISESGSETDNSNTSESEEPAAAQEGSTFSFRKRNRLSKRPSSSMEELAQ